MVSNSTRRCTLADHDLDVRIRRLEDIEAIRALKARYAYLCDTGYDPDKLAALFTEDGVWESDKFGRHVGRAAIREFFAGTSSSITFAMHYMTNPEIEVAGDDASGRWHLFQACTFAENNTPIWGSGRYFERYRRTDEGWRFRHLTLTSCFWTPFDRGWVLTRFVQDAE
jgi:ketosteroid isomerase-like protein